MSRFGCFCITALLATSFACDMSTSGPTVVDYDLDDDGVEYPLDCDDTDPAVFPGAEELCDRIDNDCDGAIDEDATTLATWYQDLDGDGYGDPNVTVTSCDVPAGYVRTDLDCDDGDSAVSPDAVEICNAIDDDCDGATDQGAVDALTWFPDADGDGFGGFSSSVVACDAPVGYVDMIGDCDDDNDGVFPGGQEICDGVDNDCDFSVDEGASDASTWFFDSDGDGFGTDAQSVMECEAPVGYVGQAGDCNDNNNEVFPVNGECIVLPHDCGVYESCMTATLNTDSFTQIQGNGLYDILQDNEIDIFVGYTATDLQGSCVGGVRRLTPRVDVIGIDTDTTISTMFFDQINRTHFGPTASRFISIELYNDWLDGTQIAVQVEGSNGHNTHAFRFTGEVESVPNGVDGCPQIEGTHLTTAASGTIFEWISSVGAIHEIRGTGELGLTAQLP